MFYGSEKQNFYFIGIGGVSMSALAELLAARGYSVRGSDASESEFTNRLREKGIPVHIGDSQPIGEEVVVYTGAISDSHPQRAAAQRAGKRLVPRSELLGRIAEEYPRVLSVAGCHGKTTTTCMLMHIFGINGAKFTCHVGGEDLDYGNLLVRGDEIFLTEACEFKRSFLALHSDVAVILSCDRDHTDCYHEENELLEAYREFSAQAKRVIVNADDVRAREIPHGLDFGLYAGRIRAERLRSVEERYSFTVVEDGTPLMNVRLNVIGKVHVLNALAAYSAARLIGFSPDEIRKGLESFRGVRRRFERIGTFGGVPVICDYAHHPREIAAAIETAERLAQGTVRVVFQPHTYTRTRDLLGEFVSVLSHADSPILYRTYSARETYSYAGSSVRLASLLPDSRYVQSPGQLRARLGEDLGKEDLILVLGAGDIYEIAKNIVDRE